MKYVLADQVNTTVSSVISYFAETVNYLIYAQSLVKTTLLYADEISTRKRNFFVRNTRNVSYYTVRIVILLSVEFAPSINTVAI